MSVDSTEQLSSNKPIRASQVSQTTFQSLVWFRWRQQMAFSTRLKLNLGAERVVRGCRWENKQYVVWVTSNQKTPPDAKHKGLEDNEMNFRMNCNCMNAPPGRWMWIVHSIMGHTLTTQGHWKPEDLEKKNKKSMQTYWRTCKHAKNHSGFYSECFVECCRADRERDAGVFWDKSVFFYTCDGAGTEKDAALWILFCHHLHDAIVGGRQEQQSHWCMLDHRLETLCGLPL